MDFKNVNFGREDARDAKATIAAPANTAEDD